MSLFACFGGRKREPRRAFDYWDCSNLGLCDLPKEVLHHRRTLQRLSLTCNNIKDVPKALFTFEQLTELDLSENVILFLPPSIRSLRALTTLNISKNSLSTIPDAIRECQDLLHLDASSNSLGSLPEGVTELRQLRVLSLNDCQLEELPPNIGKLSKLEVLELRENVINTLPQSICHLTLLERLDLGVNEIEIVTGVIGSLESLSELWLDGNLLNTLPDELGNLRNLKFLEVSENQLMFLPLSISSLVSLQDLHLSDNLLTLLPETIGELKNLRMLKLDRNRLSTLPETMSGWTNLVELSASQNFIEEVPAAIGSLQQLENLNLDENSLSSLPPELGAVRKMNLLSVRANSLRELPSEVGELKDLSMLNVIGNRLQFLPFSLTSLTNLAAVWIAENQNRPLLDMQLTRSGDGQKMLTCILLPQHPSDSPFSNGSESPLPGSKPHPPLVNFDPKVQDNKSKLTRDPTPYPKELHLKALQWRSAREEMISTIQDQTGTAEDVLLRSSSRMRGVHRPYSLIRAMSDPIDPDLVHSPGNSRPGSKRRDHSRERRENSRSPCLEVAPVVSRSERMEEKRRSGSFCPSPSPPPLTIPAYYSKPEDTAAQTNGSYAPHYPVAVSPTRGSPVEDHRTALMSNSNSSNRNCPPSVPLRMVVKSNAHPPTVQGRTKPLSPLSHKPPPSPPPPPAAQLYSGQGQSEASTLSHSDVQNPRYSSSMESGFDADVEVDVTSHWYMADTSPEQTVQRNPAPSRRRLVSDSSIMCPPPPPSAAGPHKKRRGSANAYDHLDPRTGAAVRPHHDKRSHSSSPLANVHRHQKSSRSFDGAETQGHPHLPPNMRGCEYQSSSKNFKVPPQQVGYTAAAHTYSHGHLRSRSHPEAVETTPTAMPHRATEAGSQSPSHVMSYRITTTDKLPQSQKPQLVSSPEKRERRSSNNEGGRPEERAGEVTRSPTNHHTQFHSTPLVTPASPAHPVPSSPSVPLVSPLTTESNRCRHKRVGVGRKKGRQEGGHSSHHHQCYPSDSYYTSDDSQGGAGAEPSGQATPKHTSKMHAGWSQDSGVDSMPTAGTTVKVELEKNPSLGLGIREGGMDHDGRVKPADQGYHVYKIVEGSSAENCGKIKIGDKILEINGVEVSSLDLPDIIALLDMDKELKVTITLFRETTMTLL